MIGAGCVLLVIENNKDERLLAGYMNNVKRKPFFISGNFQIGFITGFILLLFIEVALAALYIYRLSEKAFEATAFKSHITIDTGAQIIGPIILKINIYVILISILLSALGTIITYVGRHALFNKLLEGLENLKRNNLSFRINPCGRKNTRELIKEFNQAASYLDKRKEDIHLTVDLLLEEKEIKHIEKLHNKLYSIIITDKNQQENRLRR